MGPQSRPETPWHDRLENARSVEDVVETCYAYVASFAPAQLAELPADLLPPQGLDAASISAYAVQLVRADLSSGDSSPTLKAFASLFGEAAATIARIAMARARKDGWAYIAMRR